MLSADRVWHTGLLLKLKAYGIDGKLFKWFESYISRRKQCVFVSNSRGLKLTNHCLDHIDIDSKSLFITSSIVYGL
jgi:hypothetical protein